MLMTNKDRSDKRRTGLRDIWNAYMCRGARFAKFDIPECPTIVTKLPESILTWEEAKQLHKKLVKKDKNYQSEAYVCFYLDDYKFDSVRTSIWFYPWLALRILKHFRGIITPDFSLYQDFPYPIKIWNTYRMRAFGYWAGNQSLEVINNARWGTSETYDYCFEGIEKNSIVAIGTVGGSPRKLIDRTRFEEGLEEMIRRLSPKTIIVYGSSNYPCFDKLRDAGITILSFKGSTAAYYEGRNDHE